MKIIIFNQSVIEIGGIETFTYNMCAQLSPFYDICLLYGSCHPRQLDRISKFVLCEQYNNKKEYECDLFIMATSWGSKPQTIKAKKVWQMIHANYEEIIKRHPTFVYEGLEKVDKYIAVSNVVAKSFKRVYGKDCAVMYNIQMEQQPLRLVSATRLSCEKGFYRMVKLAHKLQEAKILFEWRIYTNPADYKIKPSDYPYFTFLTPTYDIVDAIRWADYGVQLSDTEGYCYFVNECLFYGTPTITTDFDSVHESVTDGVNGYIIDMKLSNLDIDKIVNHIPSKLPYKLQSTVKDWVKLIGKSKKTGFYELSKNNIVEAKCICRYLDIELNRIIEIGEVLEFKMQRAKTLEAKGKVKIVETKEMKAV